MIISSWIIDESGVRPLGDAPRLLPGQHHNDAERRARAVDEPHRRATRRRGGRS